jgi:DNA polymerase-1
MDMGKLADLSQADTVKEAELQVCIEKFLVEKGWDGTVLPVVTEITPASIKEVVRLCGSELETMVRTLSKIAPLVEALEFNGAKTLAGIIASNDVKCFNDFVAQRWVAKPSLNTGSPKQLQSLLYETMGAPIRLRNKPTDVMRSKGIREGSPRSDDDAMNMAIKRGDVTGETATVLSALIEVKSIGTRRGLYWTAYPKFLHHATGKLHPELRQSATNTRRYTGNSPNIQQMESSYGGVRSVILGHHRNALVVSLDESGQEVRQMADYAKDPNLLTCYLGTEDQLRDVHSIVASTILKCTYEEFRRRLKKGTEEEMLLAAAMRQKAKVVLFASLYGASAPKIAEGLGIEEEEAQSYIDAIYIQFPKVKDWKDQTEADARRLGYVEIHGGTIRHLRDLVTSDDKYIASKAMRQAGNARIQAAGGNQIKRVMGRIWDSNLLDDYDYRWYFSVHDESVHSVGREHAIPVIKKLHEFMTEQFLDVVPSASSIGFAKNFGMLREVGEVFDEARIVAEIEKEFAVAV